MAAFRRTIEEHRGRLERDGLVEVASSLIARIGYQDELARRYAEPQERQSRWQAVEEVVNALGQYERRARRATLGGFLDEMALADRDDEDEKERQLKRNAVALMTLHSAKGLEFSQVYLVGMEEGLLPHRHSIDGASIDEERRLCYVGITRACDRLTISLALGRMKWGKLRESHPSRFLYEITGQPAPARPKSERSAGGKPKRRTAAEPVSRTRTSPPAGKRLKPRGA